MLSSPISTHLRRLAFVCTAPLLLTAESRGFSVDDSPQPAIHPPESPPEGQVAEVNPPSLIWREDQRAASYEVEFSSNALFNRDIERRSGLLYPFFNDAKPLSPGRWFWRYYVRDAQGKLSQPSKTKSFVVSQEAPLLPLPGPESLIASMPGHPRVFVTPESLPAFRERRTGPGKAAWENIRRTAGVMLKSAPRISGQQIPIGEAEIRHNHISRSHSWKKGQPIRRQVFRLDEKGASFWLPDYSYRDLNRDAERANTLAFAYLISGDNQYADAAREWLQLVVQLRLDHHLTPELQVEHDTVVYAIEQGVKGVALAYDRLYDKLSEEERKSILSFLEYHVEPAGRWLQESKVHVEFQKSHVQQCMHNLLVTVLAAAGDSKEIDKWVHYIVPQYANRIAWIARDGGYFEGQTYGHKFAWILEGLAALRTATGLDLFKKPALRNAGTYWLYAMNLNYWHQHWGDNYSLIWPHANPRDAYISGYLAAVTADPFVKWYSETVLTDPDNIPFQYLSSTGLKPRPPVEIAQAKAFPETGVVTAYDRFYDHRSTRLFFRSSHWGSHSHSHADQNGFVLHSGGEILAPDTGYYTYSGDEYHANWSQTTFAHNSMLVNGKPQPPGIEAKGEIATFFHGGKMTYWLGDASRAYEAPLKTYHRAMLFVRPATTIIYDELEATQPSSFSWLLNTFSAPEIDAEAQKMLLAQQQTRLQVEHLLPRKLEYSSDNKRPYPIRTPGRMWSRVTEAFPQPWHNRVTSAPAREEHFLALLQAYRDGKEEPATVKETLASDSAVGVHFTSSHGEEGVALFRKRLARAEEGFSVAMAGTALSAQAEAVAILGSFAEPEQWLVAHGRRLNIGGVALWESERPASVAFSRKTPAGKALLRVDGAAGATTLQLPSAPKELFLAPANRPGEAQPLAFRWNEASRTAHFVIEEEREQAVWIDPSVDLTAPIPSASLTVTDSAGEYTLPLEAAWSESGEWVYFAEVTPREAGLYQFAGEARELLVTDRWAPMTQSTSQALSSPSMLREGSTLYFHAKPGSASHVFSAALKQSSAGTLDNLLSNGGFEEGIPLYPPRGWTIQLRRPEKAAWPEWSQEGAVEGKACLHYRADEEPAVVQSQPLRLLSGGRYHLRLKAKGDFAGCRIVARSSSGERVSIALRPSAEWEEYEASGVLPAGYCSLSIHIPAAKKGDALWVDAVEFGKITPAPAPIEAAQGGED